MLTIACYSEGTAYADEAALLRRSLDRVGMEHYIEPFRSRGDWYANTAHKAEFIRQQRAMRDGPLLYVDVDAFVHENCTDYFRGLAGGGYDFGVHWFRGPAKGHDRNKVEGEGHRMLSGTLFLGDTPNCERLLDTWCWLNRGLRYRRLVEGGGQKNLWFLVTCMAKSGLRMARLPGRYCYVFDKAWAYPADEPRIIEHTIASRDNRDFTAQTEARAARKTELRLIVHGGGR